MAEFNSIWGVFQRGNIPVQVASCANRRSAALLRIDGSNIRMAPMRGWIIGLSLILSSLWPAAAFCEGTAADVPYAATPAPPRAPTPIPAMLADISVMPAGPITWVYPVTPAAAPVLALWRDSLRDDLERAGLFSGNGPPLSLRVRIMELTVSGNTVTVFARYQLWRPGAQQPLTDIDILTDAGVTSTYAINPTNDSGQVMLDPRRIGDAVGLNIADFVVRLEEYAAQHPDWAALADRTARLGSAR
jgi:hypothetical protein